MPTTKLPESKQKAAEISRRIANARPMRRDKHAPEDDVTGGFNQKRHQEMANQPRTRDTGATGGNGQ